ncbi:MAG: ABC transporter ATP-binding protein [Bacillota bacterium]
MRKPLVVQGLTKAYAGITAVDSLDLEVSGGEIFGLLGHNGAGKTTAIECILGVKKPDAGSVTLLGMHPAKDRRRVFEKVGVQFQESHYQDKIRISELCRITASFYRHPADWQPLLQAFGLSGMEKRTVSELSGGERQRLSVVLSLVPNPDIVFLDELTTGLDTKARRDVWKLLEFLKKKGLTIFLTSHYMDEVETLCDRVCILKHGKTMVTGSIHEVTAASPYPKFEDAYLWYSGEEESNHEILSDAVME